MTRNPLVQIVAKQIQLRRWKRMPMPSVFFEIYEKQVWGSQESVSGVGSELRHTAAIRQQLPILVRELNARSLLDAACGDFNWMKEVELDTDRYVGIDIVPELIAKNKERFGRGSREFQSRDITKDKLPRVDLILCRDCLIHLSFERALAALRNFKRSGSRYLLTTTYPAVEQNRDAFTGAWHPLNLELAPFSFPKPIKTLSESRERGDGTMTGKSLGLWKLDDLPL